MIAVAGQDADAIGVQRVEGVFDFLEAFVHARDRQDGQQTVAALIIGRHFRAELVQFARQAAGFVRISEPYAGRGAGDERRSHAIAVHGLDVFGGRVVLPQSQRKEAGESVHFVAFFGGQGF